MIYLTKRRTEEIFHILKERDVTYLPSHFHLIHFIYQSSSIHFMYQSPTHYFHHSFQGSAIGARRVRMYAYFY